MVKIHSLRPEALRLLGYTQFSELNFKGATMVDTIEEADAVFIPLPTRPVLDPSQHGIHMGAPELQEIITKFRLEEKRVITYDCSDFTADYTATNPNCIFIRCSAKGWYVRQMPRTISWPWPVENWADVVPMPEGGFKYDVSGHMWLSSSTRVNAIDSVRETFGARADLVTRKEFWGYLERDDLARAMPMKVAMKKSMQESRVSLCPASIPNVFPYRFFEALSAGRVPALFCSDYVLPFGTKVKYNDFCLMFGEEDSRQAGPLIKEWLSRHTDDEIIAMGLRGREAFQQWLNVRDRGDELMTYAIEEALRYDGLLKP